MRRLASRCVASRSNHRGREEICTPAVTGGRLCAPDRAAFWPYRTLITTAVAAGPRPLIALYFGLTGSYDGEFGIVRFRSAFVPTSLLPPAREGSRSPFGVQA